MDVAATGELLGGGQAEPLDHALVTGAGGDGGTCGQRRGGQRGQRRAGAVRGRAGPLPRPAQLTVELAEVVARAGAGLHLLALQLAGQLVVPVDGEHHATDGHRPPVVRVDEQELLLDAHCALHAGILRYSGSGVREPVDAGNS